MRPHAELEARLAELRREAAVRAKATRCPRCGCTRERPCVVRISDDEEGRCARVRGLDVCTSCLGGAA